MKYAFLSNFLQGRSQRGARSPSIKM